MVPAELPRDWDVVVVGAGVAGAMSALHLARARLRVLLVEKSGWPRDKACGGCLNAAALRALAHAGITLHEGGAITQLQLACRGRSASLPLPRGIAISRRKLDAILVEHAIGAGVRFAPATPVALGACTPHGRSLLLRNNATRCTVFARVVLDCGGLATRLLPEIGWRVAPHARMGVGAALPGAPSWLRAGAIHMACAAQGYVGLVRAESGITNVAAALDPLHCREAGGPGPAIAGILDAAGLAVPDNLQRAEWCGTPRLTRSRRRFAAERVLVLGDAAGYVEPFTGEGMAWAIADAAAVSPFAREAVDRWTDGLAARWSTHHGRMARARQHVCRGVSRLLRHANMLAAALPLLDAAPAVAAPLTAWLNRDDKVAGMVAE